MQTLNINRILVVILLVGMSCICSSQVKSKIYTCNNGQADFLSEAPLEIIRASSRNLAGAINISDRSFSFLIPIRTFDGFNSNLQKTHFNEDYMESETYPNSTFKGKIIEEVDLSVPGEYKIRAKGKMYIHGVENDRIVRCDLEVSENKIVAKANFTAFLADHDISIPSILNQKIAEEIKVVISFTLTASDN